MIDLGTLRQRNWQVHYDRWSDRLDNYVKTVVGKVYPRLYATGPDYDGEASNPLTIFQQRSFTGAELEAHRGPKSRPSFD